MSPRHLLSRAATAAALLALAACGDGAAAPAPDVTGTYRLRAVNGKAPPQVVERSAAGTVELTGGTVVVGSDGTFAYAGELRVTTAGGATVTRPQSIAGVWRAAPGGIEVADDGAIGVALVTFTGGNTLTFVDRGDAPVTLVFRK
jgi:hypothetical protein